MTVAPRLACSAGSARLTTLPSIKARLDPRIVAARIHGAASDEHGAAAGGERIFEIFRTSGAESFNHIQPRARARGATLSRRSAAVIRMRFARYLVKSRLLRITAGLRISSLFRLVPISFPRSS